MVRSMNWKKLGIGLLIAFLVYFVVRSPVESATVTKNIFTAIGHFFSTLAVALTTFLQTLF